jgi:endonuclease-3
MNNNQAILKQLKATYPEAKAALTFKNSFELLIATILSAQCTDVRVNKVTEVLFQACPTPGAMVKLTQEQLSAYIKSCGLYKMKSKNILATCQIIIEGYHGEVPANREQLEQLPGVGRKTASVVLSNAFGIPAIAVDTHVFRVSNRLGLAQAKNVDKTEKQLMEIIPKKDWSDAHHWLIYHGRQVCHARNPACNECSLNRYCRDYQLNKNI